MPSELVSILYKSNNNNPKILTCYVSKIETEYVDNYLRIKLFEVETSCYYRIAVCNIQEIYHDFHGTIQKITQIKPQTTYSCPRCKINLPEKTNHCRQCGRAIESKKTYHYNPPTEKKTDQDDNTYTDSYDLKTCSKSDQLSDQIEDIFDPSFKHWKQDCRDCISFEIKKDNSCYCRKDHVSVGYRIYDSGVDDHFRQLKYKSCAEFRQKL